jgi:hypothetical protein
MKQKLSYFLNNNYFNKLKYNLSEFQTNTYIKPIVSITDQNQKVRLY